MTEEAAKKASPTDSKATDFKEPGLKHARTTNVFKIVNFELFAKPNKRVMGIGGAVFCAACAYIFYMRMTDEYKDKHMYNTINPDGSFTRREKKSKWD